MFNPEELGCLFAKSVDALLEFLNKPEDYKKANQEMEQTAANCVQKLMLGIPPEARAAVIETTKKHKNLELAFGSCDHRNGTTPPVDRSTLQ